MRLGARTLPPLMRGLPGTKLRYNDSTTWGCIQFTSADLVGTECASEVIRYNERSAPKRCFICCRYGRHCSVILQPTHALPSASESAESCNLQPRTFNCSQSFGGVIVPFVSRRCRHLPSHAYFIHVFPLHLYCGMLSHTKAEFCRLFDELSA
jgi:hypothetical protein